ncbi:MAG: hypothetical protein ABI300_09765 [Rhodanobacter sp.]
MIIAFYLTAAAMIAVALVLLLRPLLREGPRSARPRGVLTVALGIALTLPLATAGLYFLIGTPAALRGTSAAAVEPASVAQALDDLRTHLKQQPDDLAGWMLLGQTSTALHQSADARDAFDHALKLAPNNADAMVGWAEADSQMRPDHLLQGRAVELLRRAVALQPDSQRGLWLLGISDFQQARYRDAQATWRLLLPQLEPGSSVAKAVADQIAVAGARAGDAPTPTAPGVAVAPAATALQVQVAVAPALQSKIAKGDVLFVYARAADTDASALSAPVAVARLDAAALPASVSLTDAMAMTPQHRLSSAGKVFVGARISRSGQPMAQAGDLEGDAGVVTLGGGTPVKINIDRVH